MNSDKSKTDKMPKKKTHFGRRKLLKIAFPEHKNELFHQTKQRKILILKFGELGGKTTKGKALPKKKNKISLKSFIESRSLD